MSSLQVVNTSNVITSTGTAVAGVLPVTSSGGLPKRVRFSTTAPAYIKVGQIGVTAVAGDALIHAAGSIELVTAGCVGFSAISVSGTASVTATPIEDGNWQGATSPVMDVPFTTLSSIPSYITFTRADTVAAATAFDSTGRMVTYGVNLLTYSNDFTNVAWGKFAVSISSSTITTTSAANARIQQFIASVGTGVQVAISFEVTPGTSQYVAIGVHNGGGGNVNGNKFLLTGSGSVAVSTSATGTITKLANGNFRITSVFTTATTTCYFYIAPDDGSNLASAFPNVASAGQSITVVSSQVETGSTANAYSPTQGTSTSGPRFDYDPATPAGTTGVELVVSPFDVSGVPDWTTSGNSVTKSGTTGGGGPATPLVTTIGKTYAITFTISNIAGGGQAGSRLVNGGANTNPVYYSSNGTYTTYMVSNGNTHFQMLANIAGVTFTVSNISVQEVTFTPRGLLIEESRTNLLLQSRDMTQAAWTLTSATAARTQVGLDGVANTATLITSTSTGGGGNAKQLTTKAATTAHTFSAVVKAGNVNRVLIGQQYDAAAFSDNVFDLVSKTWVATGGGTPTLSYVALGGGWYRLIVTVTTVGTGSFQNYITPLNNTGTVSTDTTAGNTLIVDAAQLEVGAFATSIIPTGAATVTRAADNASMTGTNFSSWFNASAGTFVAEYSRYQNTDTFGVILEAKGATQPTTDRILFQATAVSDPRFQQVIGGVAQIDTTTTYGVVAANAVVKAANAYLSGDSAATRGGAAVTTSATTFAAPTYTNLQIGCTDNTNYGPTSSSPLNGYIRRLTFYNTRLPNATLQSLTT